MKNQEILLQLQNQLKQINMRVQLMQQHTEAIPSVEWQLFLNEIASLYDIVLFAKNQHFQKVSEKLNNDKQVMDELDENAIEAISAKFPTLNQVLKKEVNTEVTVELPKSKIAQTVETPEITKKSEVEVKKQVKIDEQLKAKVELDNQKQNIAEKYKSEQKTINDLLQNPVNTIGAQMQQQPIGDIKKAIGINEKFLFIKELFHNNEQSYYKAIDELNHCENYQHAVSKMNELAEAYQWVQESPICLKLHDLIRRRYIR